MLFDLRGSGRRTTVKVVYVTLAILMGGGLVLFGIGGSVSGGLIDAITQSDSTSATGDERVPEARRRGASARPRRTRRTPRPGPGRPRALPARAARATTSTRTRASSPRPASAQLGPPPARPGSGTSSSKPKQPDDSVAAPDGAGLRSGLNDPAKAVDAQEIVTEDRARSRRRSPTSPSLAYQRGPDPQGRPGDEQGARARRPGPARDAQVRARAGQAAGARASRSRSATPTATPTPRRRSDKKLDTRLSLA